VLELEVLDTVCAKIIGGLCDGVATGECVPWSCRHGVQVSGGAGVSRSRLIVE